MASNDAGIARLDQNDSWHKRSTDIARQALDIEFQPQDTDIPVLLDKATKLPIAEIASLGTAFASVPETF